MPEKTNRLSRFWQELKRRNVIKVVAVYAGAAYVLIELANNVADPLNFPEWTPRLVILLVVIGFPIVVILSWIFDITPEGIKRTESIEEIKEQELPAYPVRRRLKVSDGIIAVLFVAVCILLYPRIFNKERVKDIRDDEGRIHIAVMPFQNLTGDVNMEYLEKGISELLINSLGDSKELLIRPYEKIQEVFQSLGESRNASMIPSIEAEVARKTLAAFYIQGNFQHSKEGIHILLNLVNTEHNEIIWTTKGNRADYIRLVDSLSYLLKEYLEIKSLETGVPKDRRKQITNSPEAYKYYILGAQAFYDDADFPLAIKYHKEALKHDSSFIIAYFSVAWALANSGRYEEAAQFRKKIRDHFDELPYDRKLSLETMIAFREEKDIQKVIELGKERVKLNSDSRYGWYDLGHTFRLAQQYEQAIEAFEKSFEIDRSWGGGWNWFFAYYWLGYSYHETGDFKKEDKIYDLALSVMPGHGFICQRKAILAITKGNRRKTMKYISIHKAWIQENLDIDYFERELGYTYLGANSMDEAEKHFRNQLNQKPDERWIVYDLGWFLINEDININEGLVLINRAMEMESGTYAPVFRLGEREVLNINSLLCFAKGVGLFKLERYEEALQFFNRAWQEKSLYNHELFMYIQKTKQALSSHP